MKTIPFLPDVKPWKWKKIVSAYRQAAGENLLPRLKQIDRYILIVTLRSRGKSFAEIGRTIGVGRERARSLFLCAKREAERYIERKEMCDAFGEMFGKGLLK